MENFTWEILITTGGAATFVSLVTQFTKDLKLMKKIPTKIQVYVLSLIVTLTATFFTGVRDAGVYALLPANALVISFAAMGQYQAFLYKLDHDEHGDMRSAIDDVNED